MRNVVWDDKDTAWVQYITKFAKTTKFNEEKKCCKETEQNQLILTFYLSKLYELFDNMEFNMHLLQAQLSSSTAKTAEENWTQI